jgi:hypothetical protein
MGWMCGDEGRLGEAVDGLGERAGRYGVKPGAAGWLPRRAG